MSNQNSKVVLITGGSSGIGEATAKYYCQKGYRVAFTGRNKDKNAKIAKEIEKLSPSNHKVLAIKAELTDLDSLDKIIDKTIAEFGQLDILVNNAGGGEIEGMMNFKSYRDVMKINLDSPVKLTMHAIPHLKKTKGNIIMVSSVASTRPQPFLASYCTSKAALDTWAACLTLELAPDIRVNIVSPAMVRTPPVVEYLQDEQIRDKNIKAHPIGRICESDEVAKAIYFLTSDDASFMTGTNLVIDGGYSWAN